MQKNSFNSDAPKNIAETPTREFLGIVLTLSKLIGLINMKKNTVSTARDLKNERQKNQ